MSTLRMLTARGRTLTEQAIVSDDHLRDIAEFYAGLVAFGKFPGEDEWEKRAEMRQRIVYDALVALRSIGEYTDPYGDRWTLT